MNMWENLFRIVKSGRWSAKRSVLTISVMIVAITILGISVRAWYANTFTAMNPSHALQTRHEPLLGVIRFTIRPEGFDPPEVTLPAGRYLVVVKNRSLLRDVSLQIDQAAGPRLKQVSVSKRNPNWQSEFDLTPGRYTISEANNPKWVAYITITPK